MIINLAAIEKRNEERRKLRDAAYDAPWTSQRMACQSESHTFNHEVVDAHGIAVASILRKRESDFIAHARTDTAVEDIASLLAEVRRLTDDAAAKNAVIRSMGLRIEELQRKD